MTFEEYMRAVRDYFVMGGVTLEQAYAWVLVEKKPEIAMLIDGDINRVVIHAEKDFASFISRVFQCWEDWG